MLKVIVYGACGRMGKELVRLISESDDFVLAAGVDKFGGEYESLTDFSGDADVIIDFSNHVLTGELCQYAAKRKIPVVIATTGHTPEEKAVMTDAAKSVPVFHSANMSVGIALLASLAKHKVPRYIDFVKEFPMNAAGKVLKYKMREEAAERLGLVGAAGIDTAKSNQ